MRGTNSEKEKKQSKNTLYGAINFLALLRGVMRETNSKNEKNEKPRQKTHLFVGLYGDEMGLKSRDPQKALLGYLLNVHT